MFVFTWIEASLTVLRLSRFAELGIVNSAAELSGLEHERCCAGLFQKRGLVKFHPFVAFVVERIGREVERLGKPSSARF